MRTLLLKLEERNSERETFQDLRYAKWLKRRIAKKEDVI
jgi:hypothetical protein